jgi:hypothetical protein
MRGEQGFTLVEALVNVAISIVALTGAHLAYVHALKSARGQQRNIVSKTFFSQIFSVAVGSGAYIPPMKSSTGVFTYIGCYNRDGVAVKNKLDSAGMVMATKILDGKPSGYCGVDGHFEARIFAKSESRMVVQIWENTPASNISKFLLVTEREYDPPEDL